MATRPVFVPLFEDEPLEDGPLYEEKIIEFKWHPGLSVSQKRKSIIELHLAAKTTFELFPILEVSTKSSEPLGVSLSAFNLEVNLNFGKKSHVENVFQASKIFEYGGPFEDLLFIPPFKAKTDPRLRNSGKLIKFQYQDIEWSTNGKPLSLFYDWIYIDSLRKFPERIEQLKDYRGFTDIEFNPKKSLNCQARSVSILLSIIKRGLGDKVFESFNDFKSEMLWRHARYYQVELFEEKETGNY